MAEMARTFGTPTTITHKGEKYPLHPLDLEMLALFEVWLEARAYKKVERAAGTIPESLYQARLDSVTRLVNSDAFSWDGPLARKASASEEGRRYLIFLQLSKGTPGMTEDLANEIIDADQAGVETRAQQVNADPEASAEANPLKTGTAS